MKIGILTFHSAANYGAIFQAYGLQEVLKALGHEVYIVNYQPDYIQKNYRAFNYTFRPHKSWTFNLKLMILSVLTYPLRQKRNWTFAGFRKRHLQLCSLQEVNHLDVIFVGSDQIWNPLLTGHGFDEMYLGSSTLLKKKCKIAYAASAGCVKSLGANTKLVDALHSFSAISVRERSLSSYLSNSLNTFIPVVLDPVLLAGKEIFQHIALPGCFQTPYLLIFQLAGNMRVSQLGHFIAQEKGLKCIEIRASAETFKRNIHSTCAPAKVLGYFLNAAYVITSSFHGTALSLLFEKSFNVVSISPETDERADLLLCSLGLQSRKINDDDLYDGCEIDYSNINMRLKEKRKESLDFITQAIASIS